MGARDQLIEFGIVVETPPFRCDERSRNIVMLRLEASGLVYRWPHIFRSDLATSGYDSGNAQYNKGHTHFQGPNAMMSLATPWARQLVPPEEIRWVVSR